jgi:pimeloyl-ACP methyl ester carboxylesterase
MPNKAIMSQKDGQFVTRRTLTMGAGVGLLSMAVGGDVMAKEVWVQTIDTTLRHPSDGRQIKVRLSRPSEGVRGKRGMVVFSHGANSNGTLYDAMLGPLAAAGFLVAAPTHVDSETNPDRASFGPQQVLETRLADLALVKDKRMELARAAGLVPRQFDKDALVIAGHSYGALLALYLVGTGFAQIGAPEGTPMGSIRDPAYRAAIAVSPPGAVPGMLQLDQFNTIAAPILITTGRKDILPGFVDTWQARLAAFDRSATSPAFAAILEDVDHYFGGAIGRLTVPGPPQLSSLSTTNTIIAQFARSFALKDQRAMVRLNRTVSSPERLDPRLQLQRRN